MSGTGDKDLDQAIKGTEEEIFGNAFGSDGNVAGDDDAADRSLEEMDDDTSDTTAGGEGEDDAGDDAGEDDADADAGDGEGEGETETQGKDAGDGADKDGKGDKPDATQVRDQKTGQFKPKGEGEGDKPRRGDPTVPLRAERQRADKLEKDLADERAARAAERDAFKADFAKMEGRLDQILRGQQAAKEPPKAEAKTEDPEPDIFADPDGWKSWNKRQTDQRIEAIRNEVVSQRIEASFADAHERHGKDFETALAAVKALDPSNPNHVAIVNGIKRAPNPGRELMAWHKKQSALTAMGEDPEGFFNSRAEDLLKAKLADPEFLKSLGLQVVPAARGGGNGGQSQTGGAPRNIVRTPRSLNSDTGRAERLNDNVELDGSEASVFASAWK